jgi:hypothetical protein
MEKQYLNFEPGVFIEVAGGSKNAIKINHQIQQEIKDRGRLYGPASIGC